MPNLSLVLPVHNEVGSLEAVVSMWDSCLKKIPGLKHVFIICEDGSTERRSHSCASLQLKFPDNPQGVRKAAKRAEQRLRSRFHRRRATALAYRSPRSGGRRRCG